ncbi:MAG: hypothetical protein O3B21_15490 [Proteobacteria bacterium]|nr:hypothetical protein [Pseudomonadota bacterium]MDA1355110.1 hypothetical protein [Pseudomonadota bacterium]
MRLIVNMELAGGLVLEEKPFTVRIPKITPDLATGIGAWSNVEIIAALTNCVRPDGSQIHPFMPYGLYANMEKADIAALVAFLRTVKRVVKAQK